MKVGIITNSIDAGAVSIRNYTKNLVNQLLKENDIELILIHNKKSNDLIYEKAREIVLNYKYNLQKFIVKKK